MRASERFAQAAKEAGCPRDQVENFVSAGYVPQPKQLKFHSACRLCDTGGVVEVGFGGARGPGKSHAMLAQLVLDDMRRVPGMHALLLRKIGKAVKESFEQLRVRVLGGIRHEWRRSEASLVLPENGSTLVLGHFNNENDIDSYLGLQYDAIGIEEATTLSYSKYQAIGTCCRTAIADWVPRIYSSTNPGGIGHQWYKQLFITPFREGKETYTRFTPALPTDNRYLDKGYVQRHLDTLTGWKLRAWRYGDWDIQAGQYFTTWDRDVHVIKPIQLDVSFRYWLALDYGWTHWNVIYLMMEWDGTVYVVDTLARRNTLVRQLAADLENMLSRWQVPKNWIRAFYAGTDAFAKKGTTGESIADQWRHEGWPLTRADMDRVNGWAECLRRLGDPERGIKPTCYIFENNTRLAEDIPSMQHDPNHPEDILKVDTDEDEGIGGDDFVDCWRYGLQAAGRKPAQVQRVTVGYTSLGVR